MSATLLTTWVFWQEHILNRSMPCPWTPRGILTTHLQSQSSTATDAIGSIQYFANGSKSVGKEQIEIYSNGAIAVLEDFRELKVYGSGKPFTKKLMSQDKGQKNEVMRFVLAVRDGGLPPIPIVETLTSTEVTFKVIESLRTGNVIRL